MCALTRFQAHFDGHVKLLHQKIDVVLCVSVDVDRKVKHHHHWKGALSTRNQIILTFYNTMCVCVR